MAHYATGHFGTEAAEVEVGAKHILHGVAEVAEVMVVANVYGFEEFEECRTVVPGGTRTAFHHVVAFEGRQGDAAYIGNFESGNERGKFADNVVEHLTVEVNEVHFIHRKHHVLNTQQ